MIEHLVLLKVKDESTCDAIIKALNELVSKIDSIKSLSVGKNFCDRNKGYQIGLRVTFENKKGLDDYQVHPAHQEVLNTLIKPSLDDVIALDYEFNM